jgi:hypothetical protein
MRDILAGDSRPLGSDGTYRVTLEPYGYCWLQRDREDPL